MRTNTNNIALPQCVWWASVVAANASRLKRLMRDRFGECTSIPTSLRRICPGLYIAKHGNDYVNQSRRFLSTPTPTTLPLARAQCISRHSGALVNFLNPRNRRRVCWRNMSIHQTGGVEMICHISHSCPLVQVPVTPYHDQHQTSPPFARSALGYCTPILQLYPSSGGQQCAPAPFGISQLCTRNTHGTYLMLLMAYVHSLWFESKVSFCHSFVRSGTPTAGILSIWAYLVGRMRSECCRSRLAFTLTIHKPKRAHFRPNYEWRMPVGASIPQYIW